MADRVVVQENFLPQQSRYLRIGVGLLLLAGIIARFLVLYALPYFEFDPAYFKDFWPHRIRLILHISAGILTLCCGPLQFWTGLRRRAMNFHRLTGKLYLLGVAVGSLSAYSLAIYSKPDGYGVAIMVMSTAWILTTAMAYAAILRGLVNLHKEWMVRSYLVTFAFVTIRLMIADLQGITSHLGATIPERVMNVVWISWLLPIAAYEVILQTRRISGTKEAA
jgi:uncharacterized membrane protein